MQSHDEALRVLVEAGADINALEKNQYDALTIAALSNDVDLMELVIELGGDIKQTTSPYHGKALFAAAHFGMLRRSGSL